MTLSSNAGGASSRPFWEASAVLWSAIVLSLAITPIRNIELITAPVSDKLLHGLAFLIGIIVWAGALEDAPGQFRSLLTAGVVCLGMGGLIEVLQTQTTTRRAETGDIISDVVGIVAGGGIWLFFAKLRQSETETQTNT